MKLTTFLMSYAIVCQDYIYIYIYIVYVGLKNW